MKSWRVTSLLCVSLLILTALPVIAEGETQRPDTGPGAVFVNVLGVHFVTSDLDGDTIEVIFPTNAGDFGRRTPSGKDYVNAMGEDVAMTAVVAGVTYHGRGVYQTSFFGNCTEFYPEIPLMTCFLGRGPATMNAQGTVTSALTGEEFHLSAHLAGNFFDNPIWQGFYVANDLQSEIKVVTINP
jgi:hypothetical protein